MKPDSSTKTRAAFMRAAFFYPRPLFLDPAADFALVPFHGAALGLLRAPTQRMQQATDMIDVVTDAKTILDQPDYARARPKVGGEAGGLGAPQQIFLQTESGLLIQSTGAAGYGARLQAVVALLPECGVPSAHAPTIASDHLGDFDWRMSLRKESSMQNLQHIERKGFSYHSTYVIIAGNWSNSTKTR